MPGLITIELSKLRYFAYHGLYAEEKKTGNDFEVSLTVSYIPAAMIITGVASTIDYVTLAGIIKAQMNQPEDLLETVAMQIAEKTHLSFPQVKHVEISIMKLNPPIEQFTGQVGVRYRKEY